METTPAQRLVEERHLAAIDYPIPRLLAHLRDARSAEITGASGTWLAWVLADLARALKRPMAVVVPAASDARRLHEALVELGLDAPDRRAFLLPPPDVSPYGGASPDRNLVMQRMHATRAAADLRPGDVLVASAVAWSRRAAPAAALDALTRDFGVDDDLDVEDIRRVLGQGGYVSTSVVEDPGTFSVRGGVIDIFSPADEQPVRIDLYGDMVESIRTFDPATQRSGADLQRFRFSPVREEIFTEDTLRTARDRIRELADTLRIPSTRVGAILRDLADGTRFFGVETLLPAFFDPLEPLYARLPDDTCVVVVEPDEVESQASKYVDVRRVECEREMADGELVFPPEDFFLDDEAFAESFERAPRRIDVRGLSEREEGRFHFPSLDNADVVRVRKQHAGGDGAFAAVFELIETWRPHYGRIVFSCSGKGSAQRVAGMLRAHGAEVRMDEGALDIAAVVAAPCAEYEVIVGDVRDGFRSPSRGIAVVTEKEVFGRASRKSARVMAQEATAIASFKDLAAGDLVVHVDFGIGRYAGLERMDLGGIGADFVAIEYAENDKLYLPVYRLSRLQRYSGSATFTKLDKLGGTTWEKTKARVKRQLEDIAGELLRIYAERASRVGHAFSPPDEAFHELEAAFPYEETPHQAQAIEDVLADMTSPKPMDRLLCGDVGFGKTEVAVRGAYKAVLDGRQVAVLVPTTVLAEQHLETFRRRLAETAVRVEAVSRFRSTAEVKEILADANAGKVDILIGTHRLLSKDVTFKDLGLLIVDEEQRFGVKHKERLKELRATIDVLTMSATPIPRTLEMSMMGVRDLSVILTPPPGRMAIRTHIARFKEHVLREGIERELERGGQVFFVHNRVETIHAVCEELRRIVPKARLAIGHAQLGDGELEKVMHEFVSHKVDILVATTIIESGIDISAANTIFINNADRFGLAQLHQLRGRVGRGSERAYCYLLVNDPKRLQPDAKRRLEVIQEHTELGAGIQVAHHDLDMRGAGNLLGRDQSGHIESVGFELFMELLEEAVADLRGEAASADYEPEVKIPVAAYIPEDLVADVGQRLAFYKRYSSARTHEEVYDVHAELQDRYGPATTQVEALRDICLLKLDVKQMRAASVEAGPKSVVIDLMPDTPLDPDKVIALIRDEPKKYAFQPQMKLLRFLKRAEAADILGAALNATQEVLTRCSR